MGKKDRPIVSSSITSSSAKGSKDSSSNVSLSSTNQQPVREGPTRQELFGNWTGKLPINLLQEYIQRQPNWQKPSYNFTEGKRGFQCKITLGKKNKKSGEIETISYYPFNEFYPSKQEAKHSSCTFVLHRLLSDKSYHTLLPPSQRILWQKYDKMKHDKDPDLLPLEYAADPWEAKENVLMQEEKKIFESLSNPWDEYPLLYIPKALREKLEKMIRDNTDSALEGGKDEMKDTKHVKQLLIKKGFREAHVEEALEYRSELTDLLDWLAIHVPEDDLPLSQRPNDYKSIVLSNQSSEQLSRNYMIDRLHAIGFSQFDCAQALQETEWNEYNALVKLCHDFAGIESNIDGVSIDEEEVKSVIFEEKVVLESIYENVGHEETELGQKFTIEIEKLTVSLYIPRTTHYPHMIPGLAITSSHYPAYIRLAILKSVYTEASSFRGAPMIFSMISTIESNMLDILQSPPPLTSLYTRGKKMDFQIVNDKKHIRKKKIQSRKLNLPQNHILKKEKLDKLHGNQEFLAMLEIRKKLPSFKFKDKITKNLSENQCLIICGETGCGKSTQTGQFIIDDYIDRDHGQDCFIICTQPRRISATSLAERVAAERAEKVGDQIGYSIRGESKQSSKTQLLFCTNGILLRMIQEDVSLAQVSHVIIDEVHERGAESDFLLVLLRDLIPKRPDLKVILMSATIDATTISSYFYNCPILEIPGRTFPVSEFYLEHVLAETNYIPENTTGIKTGKKCEQDQDSSEWEQVFSQVDSLTLGQKSKLINAEKSSQFQIDYGLVSACVKHICNSGEEGAILIFLPGVMEIKKTITRIKSDTREFESELEIFPLHSMLTSKEQSLVFKRMKPGKRKVVVSTNIAETSVTIDDVVFCIDTGRVKEMRLVNGVLSLTEVWTSKASCKQRKGRAGRVKPGTCFKLFTSYFEEGFMKKHSEPEILRLPLEQLCLQIKAMGILDVGSFLGKALSPPPTANIQEALDLLESINALRKDGTLTPLGQHISLLPTDVRVGKMLVFGAIFHCLDPILTIAACISGKGPFTSPLDKRQEAAQAQRKFGQYKSDFLAACFAFDEWSKQKGKGNQKKFCDDYFLSMTNLLSIQDLRNQFADLLREIGYLSRDTYELVNENSKNEKIVKSVILAGLFPNIASIKMPKQVFNKTAEGTIAIDAHSSEIKYYARGERVFIHPSSQLFQEQKYEQVVMVYGTKVSTSKIFIRDCSVAPSCSLMLFSSDIQVVHGGNSIAINNVRFQAFPRVTSLITGMRKLLNMALEEKIKNPHADVIQSDIGKLCLELLIN